MVKNSLLTTALITAISIISNTTSNAAMLTTQQNAHSLNQYNTNILKVHDRYHRHSHNNYDGSRTRKSIDQVKFKLEKRGYNKISVLDNRSPIYLLKACRDGVKYKLAIRDSGSIKYRNKIGYCSRRAYKNSQHHNSYDRHDRYQDGGISPSRVLRIVGQHGYGRAYFIDRHPPVYKLNACRGGIRYNLSVNDYGSITRSQKVGYCSTGSRYIDYWRSPRRFK